MPPKGTICLMKFSLDPMRDDWMAWAESLWLEKVGAFREPIATAPSLPGTLFMVYILYSVDALDAVACARKRWIAWIQGQQHPVLGTWPREEEPENISRTFACSLIHLGMGGCLRGRGGSSTPCWISKGATVSGAGLPSFAAIAAATVAARDRESRPAPVDGLPDSLLPGKFRMQKVQHPPVRIASRIARCRLAR